MVQVLGFLDVIESDVRQAGISTKRKNSWRVHRVQRDTRFNTKTRIRMKQMYSQERFGTWTKR